MKKRWSGGGFGWCRWWCCMSAGGDVAAVLGCWWVCGVRRSDVVTSGCCHGGDVVVRMAAGVVGLAVGDRRSSEVAEKVAAVHGDGGWWIG
nr:hypothetical protein [Tanacetum cinerariifolium]